MARKGSWPFINQPCIYFYYLSEIVMLCYENPSVTKNPTIELIMNHINHSGRIKVLLDSQVAPTSALLVGDMHNRIHLIFCDEFGDYGHTVAENLRDAVSKLVDHRFTKVATCQRIYNCISRAPHGCNAMIFDSLAKALLFRCRNGGWIYEPEQAQQCLWFDNSFTPSKIMQHPLTQGGSGKLI